MFKNRYFKIAAVGIVFLAVAYVTLNGANKSRDLTSLIQNEGLNRVPIPFITPQGALDASIVEIGRIGSGGALQVFMVELSEPNDLSQMLFEDKVYLVKTSADADDVPFDLAFLSGIAPDYFLYKYTTIDATDEIVNRTNASFLARFPGQFGASATARANEAQHNNAISTFEQQHGVAFGPTHNTGGTIRFQPNSLYAVIVNEPSGRFLMLHTFPVCGNGWVSGTEECDDGNEVFGDGCSDNCVVEFGFVCTGNPSICTAQSTCGNSVIEAGEQCDMGAQNGVSGGNCLSNCMLRVPLPFN